MKITNKSLLVSAEESIQIGEFKANLNAQMWVTIGNNGVMTIDEIEDADVSDITYMGIPINDYRDFTKFKEFHKEMGIDFDKLISAEFKRIFSREVVENLILNNIKIN